MDEDQLRTIVREAIARHLSASRPAGAAVDPWKAHASHFRLPVATGQQLDGPCLIEPAVPCHHCGYCQSLGH